MTSQEVKVGACPTLQQDFANSVKPKRGLEFQNLGVGGLDDELKTIFRRAFASRHLPPDLWAKFGCKHVKGVLLYGPSGTGKTLIAHQIAKFWNSREPKVVNGLELSTKDVEDSEADICKFFVEAQEEEKLLGPKSGLHIIIFDNIDAICRERVTVAGAAGAQTSLVYVLSSIMDGFIQLNNVLVIGTTMRKDLVFEELLRPGRLEVHVEIGLPNEAGRAKILDIHTAELRENNMLSSDVDILELAALTKNFTGAEIEGLVGSAQSMARNRLIQEDQMIEINLEAREKVLMSDFKDALERDITPAFNNSAIAMEPYISRGIISSGDLFQSVFPNGHTLIQRAKNGFGIFSLLLEGLPGAGKTAIAAQLIKDSGFFSVQFCSRRNMTDLSESAKIAYIRKLFDNAAHHKSSCILIDNIEGFVDYDLTGLPFSVKVLQNLMVLIKERTPAMNDRKLLVICTTSCRKLLEELEMLNGFNEVVHVPYLKTMEHVVAMLKEIGHFSESQIDQLVKKIGSRQISIPIKKLGSLIDMTVASDEHSRVSNFIGYLESAGFIYYFRS